MIKRKQDDTLGNLATQSFALFSSNLRAEEYAYCQSEPLSASKGRREWLLHRHIFQTSLRVDASGTPLRMQEAYA